MTTESIEDLKNQHKKSSGRLCWRARCAYLVVCYALVHLFIMGKHVLPGFLSPSPSASSSLQDDGSTSGDFNILEDSQTQRYLKPKRSKGNKSSSSESSPTTTTKTTKSSKSVDANSTSVATSSDSKTGKSRRRKRRLVIDNAWETTTWVDEDGSVTLQKDNGEDEDDENPCEKVLTTLTDTPDNRQMCIDYLSLPHVMPDCDDLSEDVELVPTIYHSVAATSEENYQQRIISAFNPQYRRNHLGDNEAYTYIYEKCGMVASQAYKCLQPSAYRADLFRLCALYTEGGIYLDADILPVVPLEELYSPCSTATIGHDTPQAGLGGKQMKILAGKPKAPIFKCAMDHVIHNVKARNYTVTSLGISGPQLLHECYEQHSENVAISYHDTRGARWPYTGMRRGSKLLANEIPNQARLENDGDHDFSDYDYDTMWYEEDVYSPSCPLSLKAHTWGAGGVIIPIET